MPPHLKPSYGCLLGPRHCIHGLRGGVVGDPASSPGGVRLWPVRDTAGVRCWRRAALAS